MKKAFLISVMSALAMSLAWIQSYAAGTWTGNINVYYGIKTLESDDLTTTGDYIDIDIHETGRTKLKVSTQEIRLRVKKIWL